MTELMLTPVGEDALIRKVVRRIIPFCILCFLLNYIDRTNIGMAESSMEKYIPSFNKNVFTFGLSLFYIPYCLLELPSNLIQQRVGARRWIARIMISWGIVSSCYYFARTEAIFYTLRLLLGAAEAGFFPGVILYLSYWIPHRYRARATALFILAQAMAQVIGNTCGGFILYFADKWHLPLEPWQWLFLLEGIPSIMMGVVVLFFLTDKPQDAKWLTLQEREKVEKMVAEDRSTVHTHRASDFKAALASPQMWILSVLYSMMVWGYFPVQGFSQVLLKPILVKSGAIVLAAPPATGAATTTASTAPAVVATPDYIVNIYIGLLTAIPFAVAAVAMLFYARHSDRRNERKFHIAFACFLMTLGLATCALAPRFTTGTMTAVTAVAGFSIAACGWFCSFAIFWSVPAQLLTGTAVAAAVAIINSIGNLVGNFIGPNTRTCFGMLPKPMTDEQYLLVAAGCAFIGAVLAATLQLRQAEPPGFPVNES